MLLLINGLEWQRIVLSFVNSGYWFFVRDIILYSIAVFSVGQSGLLSRHHIADILSCSRRHLYVLFQFQATMLLINGLE